MIDVGQGSPLVIIPGIQGRWEWMRPAMAALSASHRVLSFSLTEVPADAHCFDRWEAFIDGLLDRAGIAAAALVGVSFGGLIAARYGARRPERVRALVLVSTPAPTWRPEDQRAAQLQRPIASAPAFAIQAIGRVLPEVIAALPTWPARIRCLAGHLGRVVRYPASPRRMAVWVRAWQQLQLQLQGDDGWSRISAPTLVITGEPGLDRVVPTATTLEYLSLIPGARHCVLQRTGHIGLVSRPAEFAKVVSEFVDDRERP